MEDAGRFCLHFGPYRTPKCKVGKLLQCVVRGEKKVIALSDAPIPWPMTQHDAGYGRPYLILCGDLVKAIRRESNLAVAHWWGVRLEGARARDRSLAEGEYRADGVRSNAGQDCRSGEAPRAQASARRPRLDEEGRQGGTHPAAG
jgi:hypothetical protein